MVAFGNCEPEPHMYHLAKVCAAAHAAPLCESQKGHIEIPTE